MKFRAKAGELSAFVLDSLRGLPETIQYGQGASRIAAIDKKSDALSDVVARMKKIAKYDNICEKVAVKLLLGGNFRFGYCGNEREISK